MSILDTYDIPDYRSNVVDTIQVHALHCVNIVMSYDIIAGPVPIQWELYQWKDKMCVSVRGVVSVGGRV